jgi:hypothetical protein
MHRLIFLRLPPVLSCFSQFGVPNLKAAKIFHLQNTKSTSIIFNSVPNSLELRSPAFQKALCTPSNPKFEVPFPLGLRRGLLDNISFASCVTRRN